MSSSSAPDVEEIELPPPKRMRYTSPSDGVHWDSVEEVAKMNSTLQSDEALLKLCSEYNIDTKEFRPFCAKEGCEPWTPPPEGSNAVCIFQAMLEAGVRFPIHEFYAKILRHYSLAPSQLVPNAWRYMVGFVLQCEAAEVTPMAAVFRHYFALKSCPGTCKGFYYFAPSSRNRQLFKPASLPSNDGWKLRFFFLEARSPDQPWRFPTKWRTPKTADKTVETKTRAMETAISKLEENAKKDDVMRLLYMSRDEDKLPVLDGLSAQLKLESSDAAEERALTSSERKYKSLAAITNPHLYNVPVESFLPESNPILPCTERDELSASQSQLLVAMSQLLQKTEAEVQRVKHELRLEIAKHAGDLAQRDRDLGAAKAEYTAKIVQLTEQLQAEKIKHAGGERDLVAVEEEDSAEIARLAEELQAEKTKHSSQVAQLVQELEVTRAQHLDKVRQFTEEIQAEHDKALELDNAHKTEVCQLKNELQASQAQYVVDVGSLKAQMKVLWVAQTQHETMVRQLREQSEAAEAEHSAKIRELTERLQRYVNGVKAAMRELNLTLHSGSVATTLLTPDELSGLVASPQATDDQ